jgi:alpha-L-fucosidase
MKNALLYTCRHIVLCLLLAGIYHQDLSAQQKIIYQPDWNSLQQHTEVPEWIRDAKFGIYCHWGVYTVPAYNNEHYYSHMHADSGYSKLGTYQRHQALYGPLTKFGYHDFIPMFKGERFNADEWADLFVKSGARFAGPVGEHHDGFSMWDSKLTPFNAKQMGPHRDVVGELEKAIRKRGMKFFISLHHELNYGYVKPKPGWAAANPKYAKLYGTPTPHDQWLNMWMGKCNEVADKYHPDIMYFDSWLEQIPEQYIKQYLAHYFNAAEQRRQEVTMTYKGNDIPDGIGMLDHENTNPDHIVDKPWLCDYSIGSGKALSWGYTEGMDIRTPREIIHKIIEVVSKNGQLLLNLSPKSDGSIPQDQQEVMFRVGKWMWAFGEGIYNTRPFSVFGETTTEGQRVHYTRRGDTLYAIFLEWPGDGKTIQLKTLNSNTIGKVQSLQMLGLKALEPCPYRLDERGLSITIPAKTRIPSDFAYVFRITTQHSIHNVNGNGQQTPTPQGNHAQAGSPLPLDETPLFDIIGGPQTPVIQEGMPGTEGIQGGFEGGACVKVNGVYHMFPTERAGQAGVGPYYDRVKTRIGHWTSKDAIHWKREATIYQASGQYAVTDDDNPMNDRRGAIWSFMPVFDTAHQRWYGYYLAYTVHKTIEPNHSFGRIWRAESVKAGLNGICGPYKDKGIILEPGMDSQLWEGRQGVASFFPYPAGKEWLGFYAGAYPYARAADYPKKTGKGWFIGLARSASLEGPWTRLDTTVNPVTSIHPYFVENPIVSKLPNGIYIAIFDGGPEGFGLHLPNMIGYTLSKDGLHWSPARYLPIHTKVKKWWDIMRTPLCLIPEGNDRYTILYAAINNQQRFHPMGMVQVQLNRQALAEITSKL